MTGALCTTLGSATKPWPGAYHEDCPPGMGTRDKKRLFQEHLLEEKVSSIGLDEVQAHPEPAILESTIRLE